MLKVFLFSIGPFCASGVGALWLKESFWRLAISRKFGVQEGGWCTHEVREGYGVGLWKEGSLLFKNIVFSMGDGRRVRF